MALKQDLFKNHLYIISSDLVLKALGEFYVYGIALLQFEYHTIMHTFKLL